MSSKGGRPRIRIALRELSTLKSEKTIVLALLIQLVIAAFSSFLVVGLVSLYDPASAGGQDLLHAVGQQPVSVLLHGACERPCVRRLGVRRNMGALKRNGERIIDPFTVHCGP